MANMPRQKLPLFFETLFILKKQRKKEKTHTHTHKIFFFFPLIYKKEVIEIESKLVIRAP